MTLDHAIQLHEELRVWYSVDGYVADLQTHDGARIAIRGVGDTPEQAIDAVRSGLHGVLDLNALRSLPDVIAANQ